MIFEFVIVFFNYCKNVFFFIFREIELGELYSLGSNDLDLLMAETAEIRSDLDFKEKNIGKFRTAGYFLELARIIEKRKLLES